MMTLKSYRTISLFILSSIFLSACDFGLGREPIDIPEFQEVRQIEGIGIVRVGDGQLVRQKGAVTKDVKVVKRTIALLTKANKDWQGTFHTSPIGRWVFFISLYGTEKRLRFSLGENWLGTHLDKGWQSTKIDEKSRQELVSLLKLRSLR
jgi:hypothetical protein